MFNLCCESGVIIILFFLKLFLLFLFLKYSVGRKYEKTQPGLMMIGNENLDSRYWYP